MTDREIINLCLNRLGLQTLEQESYDVNYIVALLEGSKNELEKTYGINCANIDSSLGLFLIDYICYQYLNRDSVIKFPRHLEYRLHNLILNKGK